jgi:hypothetical protein
MDFGKYIRELLMIHDCVILPGLGGFIANYKHAELQPNQQVILPPSKQILFNPNLVHNDGLLYSHVSMRSEYGYKDVQSMADGYVNRILRETDRGSKFNLDDLGYFYVDAEKKLQFAADVKTNLLTASYGLPPIQYQVFETRRISETRKYRSVPPGVEPVARRQRTRRFVMTAAAACLAAALVVIPIRTGYFSEARLDITERTQSIPAVPSHEGKVEQLPAFEINTPATSQATIIPVTYSVIVGSFKEFGNARQLRNNLVQQGYEARILAGDNAFFRVSAGHSTLREAACAIMSDVRSRGYDSAWMLSN